MDFTRLAGLAHEGQKNPGFRFDGSGKSFQTESVKRNEGSKNEGGSWFNIGSPGQKVTGRNSVTKFETERDTVSEEGRKVGGDWFGKGCNSPMRLYSSKSPARKAASAKIAKIPFPLASHIAYCFHPDRLEVPLSERPSP